MPPVVVVLGPGRSYTTIAAAMLGQHPSLFGLPETNLSLADTLADWLFETGGGRRIRDHGLLRALSHIEYGVQSTSTVAAVRAWLRRHQHLSTDEVWARIRAAVAPRGIVEKSPITVMRDDFVARLWRQLPDAYYLHITRHPHTACMSMLRLPPYKRLLQSGYTESYDTRVHPPVCDPQVHWYSTHERIMAFLAEIEPARWRRVRGEDLLEDPDARLADLCRWLGLDAGTEAIAAMKQPERSPFACHGPPNAQWGADPSFQSDPALRPYEAKPAPLSAPLEWRPDGAGFAPCVRELAASFGYEDGAVRTVDETRLSAG